MEDHFLYGRWSCSQLNVLGTSNYHGLHTERTGEDDVQWDSAARAEKLLWHRWIEEIHRNHPCNIPKAIFTYICLICMVNVGKYTLHRWDGYSFLTTISNGGTNYQPQDVVSNNRHDEKIDGWNWSNKSIEMFNGLGRPSVSLPDPNSFRKK